MQNSWQAFLEEQEATIQDSDIIEFDNTDISITETPLASPLSGFALLAINGNDRHAFLHSQLINDLNLIEEPAAQLSAWCNPKGQVISNFLIINTGISYLLIFRKDLKKFVKKRLRMFVMRSDVTIENITDLSPLIGLANTNSNNLSSLGLDMPTNSGQVHATDGLIIICHPDNSNRYLITGSIESLINKLPELNKSLTMTSSSAWNLLDIFSGLPWITSNTKELFLPQMLNLDVLNGLSYQKGCYPGQEVIARLHYRGEVKKRLQIINSEVKLNVGGNIYEDQSENKVGTIINHEKHSDGNFYGLAVIALDTLNEKLFFDKKEIKIVDLPYAISP
jgi:tRNA-modifying protein YgfZ